MSKKTADLCGNGAQREFATTDWRAGVAKDKLIFIIICSVAMAVAAVTLVHFFTGKFTRPPGEWQCLKCDYEFSKKITDMPPIYCPKCGGPAARLYYRICPKCKKENVESRIRLTAEGEAMVAQHGGPGPGYAPASEIQYRVKQSDGSYAWTEWMPRTSLQAQQIYLYNLVCTKCGANLYGQPAR